MIETTDGHSSRTSSRRRCRWSSSSPLPGASRAARSSRGSTSLEERHEGRLLVARLDIDANLGVPGRYGVLSLPTVMVFSGGEPGEAIYGAQPRRRYEEAAERALAGAAS